MKVSIDFDNTLTRETVQRYARGLQSRGIEVWVVTTRHADRVPMMYDPGVDNSDLWAIVDGCKIPRDHVVFTEMEWKASFFEQHPEFLWHLDDNYEEVFPMRKCKTKLFLVISSSWKSKCEREFARHREREQEAEAAM